MKAAIKSMVNTPSFLVLFCALVASLGFLISCEQQSSSTSAAGSEEKGSAGEPTASENTSEEGFVELFNGKDLSGWTISKENPESFSVKDGKLIVNGGRSHIFYSGDVNGAEFKNFELKVRAMTKPNANSGVYFHTQYQDEGWPENGYECQVNATHKDPKKTGSLYGVRNIIVLAEGQKEPKGGKHEKRDQAPNTDNEWFDYHITVKGKEIHVRVNGETTVQYTEPEGGPEEPGFKGRRLGSGTFGIQAHDPDSEIHYESFRVKVLD